VTVAADPLVDEAAVARTPGATGRRIPGEEGLWVFLLGDMVIFALFFGTLVVTRAQQPEVFHAGQEQLHPWLGLANTMLLLTGSILVVHGVRRVRSGGERAAALFGGALICGLGFAAVKVCEYTLLVGGGYTAGTSDYFMYYFVFTGIHLAHLAIGVILMAVLVRVGLHHRPGEVPSAGRIRLVECGGCYWHMVDLLWLVLFPLLYLVR